MLLIYRRLGKMSKYVKYVVLIIGIGMLVWGIVNGDMAAVLRKAAAICMECIGIG